MEIKATELRIGNWVMFSNEFYTILAVEDEMVRLNTDHKGFIEVFINEIHPIPLTEKILLKVGFEESVLYLKTYSLAIKTTSVWNDIFIDLSVNFCMVGSIEIGDFKYLHQLQNLFYSFCGKELEIEL